jgi:hypothetical protein
MHSDEYIEQLKQRNAQLEKLCADIEDENKQHKEKFKELLRRRHIEVPDFGEERPESGFKIKGISYVM